MYDWSRLGERPFESLCPALAVQVLGPELLAFGDGPDGGREASSDGPVRYSTSSEGACVGHRVPQAKYRRTGAGSRDVDWLRRQIVEELDDRSDPNADRVRNR